MQIAVVREGGKEQIKSIFQRDGNSPDDKNCVDVKSSQSIEGEITDTVRVGWERESRINVRLRHYGTMGVGWTTLCNHIANNNDANLIKEQNDAFADYETVCSTVE